ncbi:hypothetical protein [Salinicoccus bachuensis]|uniref:Lipoprotein n=1 Tax=Salinicoccus bachuensis TaxID=3136731 RepID=A0ABZ3CG44_9STAP
MRRILVSGLTTGVVSGVLLFLACAYVESSTGIEIMTLLLNVDFIFGRSPGLFMELIFHLMVSVTLAIILKWLYLNKSHLYMPGLATVWVVVTLLYFVLSSLSVQNLELNGYIGFALWMIFHIGYLQALHLMFRLGF